MLNLRCVKKFSYVALEILRKLPSIFIHSPSKGSSMDRKYLSHPFDMSEYIYGKRFVLGGVDFDIKDEEVTPPKTKNDEKKNDALTPED